MKKHLWLLLLLCPFLFAGSIQQRHMSIIQQYNAGAGVASFCDTSSADFCSDWDGVGNDPTDSGLWAETDPGTAVNVVDDKLVFSINGSSQMYVIADNVHADARNVWIYLEFSVTPATDADVGTWDLMKFLNGRLGASNNISLRFQVDGNSPRNFEYVLFFDESGASDGGQIDTAGVITAGYTYKIRVELNDLDGGGSDECRLDVYDTSWTNLVTETDYTMINNNGFDGLLIGNREQFLENYPLTFTIDNVEMYFSDPGWW